MKSTKKLISIVLAVMMLMTCVSVSFTVNAATGTLSSYYATNPGGKTGVQKTISIDGDASDWSEDMLIAQGAAWDVANHWKGGHENCVLDTTALYATWDNDNLYVGWQMVNTTDTWGREGDASLSDGGRVLDVPLVLALSVDPKNTSMTNKIQGGKAIWSENATPGVTFDTHVDHLLYMSGKVGLGEPALFKAVDAEGNTNYTKGDGCFGFAQNGIAYKMAETNISSKIMGLNGSNDPSDIFSEDADWVDYKTFAGQSGTHNTKYDSFYEIKVPLKLLGIDASYIQNNGIGAMVVATRGESGLDCIPFDATMIDNATDDYSKDPSTSYEKEDQDVITVPFARIGKGGAVVPTEPDTEPETEPTTEPTTVDPDVTNLTVNAKSNLFSTETLALADDAKTVTVRYDLESAMDLVNGQWKVTYDPSKLTLTSSNEAIMPTIADDAVRVNNGTIKGNFTNIYDLYDFSTSKPFIELTFDVIGTGNTDVTLDVQELSVGYLADTIVKYKNAVANSAEVDLSKVEGFESSAISGAVVVEADAVSTTPIATTAPTTEPDTTVPTGPVDDDLTVNVTSNFFPEATKTYPATEKEVTVTFMLSSSMDLINSEWALKYDTSKLSFDKTTINGLMPNASSTVIKESKQGVIKGNFTTLGLLDFKDEKAFVTVTFDVIGTGKADIDMYVDILGVAYIDSNGQAVEDYVVDFGTVTDVTKTPGFESEVYTTDTIFSEPTAARGDVNGDGYINIKDATLIQKILAEIETPTEEMNSRADADNDGFVTVKDASLIQKYVAGLVTSI